MFERDQLRGWVKSQFRRQHIARPAQCAQRVSLPAGLILRLRQECPAHLPKRRLGHPGLRLGQDGAVLPGAQRRVGVRLLRLQAELLEPSRRGLALLPALELDQRPTPPERECLAENMCGPLGLAERRELLAAAEQAFEAMRVDVVGRKPQAVTLWQRLDRARAESSAQPDHAALHHLVPGRWHTVGPQSVGQAVGADGVTRAQRQRREHDSVAPAQRHAIPIDQQGPEHGHAPHTGQCRAPATPSQLT